jgi:hypothetical protein
MSADIVASSFVRREVREEVGEEVEEVEEKGGRS